MENLSLKAGAATSHSYNDSGLAYGAGAVWNLDDANGLRLDYTRYDTTPDPAH